MPRWSEQTRQEHSTKMKGRKHTPDTILKLKGPRKDAFQRFYGSKGVRTILGEEHKPKPEELSALEDWFSMYPVDKSRDWFENIARWIALGVYDFVERRCKLNSLAKMSEEAFVIRYGHDEGVKQFRHWMDTRASVWTKEYWLRLGLTEDQATTNITQYQKENSKKGLSKRGPYSCRNYEFYVRRGMNEDEAKQKIAASQRRDLDFYRRKYGEEDGTKRFEDAKKRRQVTWETKDRVQHGTLTAPKSFNENGMEAQAINLFLDQNSLRHYHAMHGKPIDQFSVLIPGLGIRRYDLALFDPTKDRLVLIFEFHGPTHINFSHFDEILRDECVWDDKGRLLPYRRTFGQMYDNDLAKRQYIEETYPDAQYLVGWVTDFQKKDFTIANLTRRYSVRLSEAVLHNQSD